MPRANNPVLGYLKGDCGHRSSVHAVQKGKRAGYLYLRCTEGCGADQRVGPAQQGRWHREAEWLGEAPAVPPNVTGTEGADWTPAKAHEDAAPVAAPETTPAPKGRTGVLAGILTLAGAALLIWRA